MSNPFDEKEGTLHRALLNCIRRCSNSEERRGYLLVIEQNIANRTGVQLLSAGFFDNLFNSCDEIRRNLTLEIQEVKMEEQVQSLGLDCSPPEEESALGNMMREDEMLNSVDFNDLSSDFSEDDNFIDLNDLILNEQANIVDLQTDEDIFGADTQGISITDPVTSDTEHKNVISSANGTFLQDPTINHVAQTVNGDTGTSDHDLMPDMFPPLSSIPLSSLPQSIVPTQSIIPPSNILPPSSRPPGSLPPSSLPPGSLPPGSLPPGGLPPNGIPSFGSIPPDDAIPPSSTPPLSSVPPNTIPPLGTASSSPAAAPDGMFPPSSRPPGSLPPDGSTVEICDTALVQHATRTPGSSGSANVSNAVPQLPLLTMVRPRGFLPSSQPSTPPVNSPVYLQSTESSEIRPRQNATSGEGRFSRQNTAGSEGRFSRQSSTNVISRKNSDYEARALPRVTAVSSDYSSDASPQNSADRENNRSSSGEGDPIAPLSQPDTHKGSTVYRAKRISHVQLLAFLNDSSLKTELKELGAFYLISACEDPNFYNISFSGDRAATLKAMELFKKTLPPDTTEYITEEVPIPVYPELKESGYLLKLIRQLYNGVDMTVEQGGNQLVYHLSGPNNHVFEVVSLIKFMTSLPDKKFGMLLKLHTRLTSSVELIDRLVNSAQTITKSPVMCLDCTKTEACKFLFVPGLCGTENQYKLQKHLNVLVEKLEQAECDETSVSHVDVAEVADKNITKYRAEEMLVIRENCAQPHPALLKQSSLPIRLIAKLDK